MPTNITPFMNTLKDYINVSTRDIPYILNKVNGDIQFEAAKRVGKADKSSIEALPLRPWWGRFLSKLLSNGVSMSFTKKKKKVKKLIRVTSTSNKYTKYLERLSKAIVRNRKKGITLLSSSFYKAAKVFKATTTGTTKGLIKSQGYGNLASQGRAESRAGAIVFSPDIDSEQSATNRMERAREAAILFKIDDMSTYILDKQLKKAKQISK